MKEQLYSFCDFVKTLPVIGPLLEGGPKVAVIRFSGIIADDNIHKHGICHARYAKIIDKAFDKAGIVAVALVINSPGGSAAQSELIGKHIRQRSEEKEIPVYSFVEDVAASGGYWLACAGDEIYAQETSIVGSIGVISASFGFEDFIEKHQIHRRLYSAGKNKSFLDPFSPQKKDDLDRLDKLLKNIHDSFKGWVRERRGEKLAAADAELFEGAFWTAGPGLEKGLVDGINDMRSFMREKHGEKVRFTDLTPSRKFSLPLPLKGQTAQGSVAEDILDTIESRSLWSRYGL